MKSQKPINIDCHLEYRCPNSSCFYTHWLSLKETKTKNFKVVCDCGTIFKPKQIKDIKILYEEIKVEKIVSKNIEPRPTKTLPLDVLEKSSMLLEQYGFTKQEANEILLNVYKTNQTDNVVDLVKLALMSLEIKNV